MTSEPTQDEIDAMWREFTSVDQLAREVFRLREDCAEAYQAVGHLADKLGYWEPRLVDHDMEPITKLLDNLSAAAGGDPRPWTDLLPFIVDIKPSNSQTNTEQS